MWFFITIIALPLLILAVYSQTKYRSRAADSIPWQPAAAARLSSTIPSPQQILEVRLHYDATKTPIVSIQSTAVKTGYVSKPPYQQKDYILKLYDQNNRVLLSHTFTVPKDIPGPPPLEDQEPTASDTPPETPLRLTTVDFALTTPWDPNTSELVVVDTAGAIVTRYQLAVGERVQESVTAPAFFTVSGSELSGQSDTRRQSAPGDDVLDITFISDDYESGNMGTFHTDVNRFVAHLVTYEPFGSRVSQIRFSYVDNIRDLACHFVNQIITCDYLATMQAVNDAGAPNEKVVIIYNNATYGGSGGPIAIAYNGAWGPQVFVHEFGHSLGYLIDEYLLNDPTARTDRNCYDGTPPNPLWQSVVPLPEYYQECDMPAWYRSSRNSVMRSFKAPYFNAVSQKYLNEAFDYYASPILLPTPTPLAPVPEPIVNNFTIQAILHNADGSETVFPSVNAVGIVRFEEANGSQTKPRVNYAKCMNGGVLSLPIVSSGTPCGSFAPGRYATQWRTTVKIGGATYTLISPTTCTNKTCSIREQSEMITGGRPIHRGVYQAPAPKPTKASTSPKAPKPAKGKRK